MADETQVKVVKQNNVVLAIVVKASFNTPGCTFVSPDDFPMQLGMNIREKGEIVVPHKHIPFKKLTDLPVQEFLYVEDGEMKVNLYNEKKVFETLILNGGDMILLNCAHSVEFTKKTKMIEVKQGPYRGKNEEKEFF